jgi:hypothetical protein
VGKTYKIDVNVSRILSFLEQKSSLPMAWLPLWTNSLHYISTFLAIDCGPITLVAIVCLPEARGSKESCKIPGSKSVNANDLLILKATGRSVTPGTLIQSAYWSIESHAGLLSDENVLTNMTYSFGSVLVLRSGLLTQGHTYAIQFTARNRISDVGRVQIKVKVRMAPAGGDLVVSPVRGIGMHTNFTLEAKDWATDVENFPLMYSFLCKESGVEPELATPLWTGTLIFTVTTLLPSVGASLGDEPLLIMVRISDINGAWTMASTSAHVARATQAQTVELLPMLNNVLLTHVDDMSRVGDVANAQICVGLIAYTHSMPKRPATRLTLTVPHAYQATSLPDRSCVFVCC